MRRLRPVLLGVAGGLLPVAVLSQGGPAVLVVAGGALALVYLGTAGRPSVGGADITWVPTGPFVFVPASTRLARSSSGAPAALGRVETRLLLRSAAFWTGLAFSGLAVWRFGWVWGDDSGGEVAQLAEWCPLLVHPLVGMVVVAGHRARTRSRRDGVEELFSACPVSSHQRDVAHLRTAWVGALAALVTAVGVVALPLARLETWWGPFGGRQIAQMLGGVLLAVGALALGVLLARVAPWTITPVLALVGIGLVSLRLADRGEGDTDGISQLTTGVAAEDVDIRFTAPHWLAHHLWIAALVALVVSLALLLGSRRRIHAVALVIAAVAAIAAGWGASRPMADDDVARIAALIAHPEEHQTCIDVGVPLCTYAGDEALVDAYTPHLADVLDALPPGIGVEGLTFRQGADVRIERLDDAVRTELADWQPPPDVPPMRLDNEGVVAARFWLALAATGITAEREPGRIVVLAGQARGVVAIWLASQGISETMAIREMASLGPPADHGEDPLERPWPDVCVAGPAPVQWAHTDLDAARQLIVADTEDVTRILHSRWSEWLDPDTTTDQLLMALGLRVEGEPVGRTGVTARC